ncbi:MAG: outer membrane protein [Micropepsaceae bacterium]
MRIKHILLTTTALALFATVQQADADGLYVSFVGGGNLLQDESSAGTAGYYNGSGRNSFDADTGFALGAAVGVGLDNWLKGLRTEIEASYRRSDVSGNWFEYSGFYDTSDTGTLDANLSTFAVMANVAYDFDVGMKVKPYVTVGAGWARTHIEGFLNDLNLPFANPNFQADNSGFAWQLGAGVNYEVAPGIQAGIGYRYFDAPEASYFAGKNDGGDRHENNSHAVMFNVTIDTN